MKKLMKNLVIASAIMLSFSLTSCSVIEDVKVKFNLQNTYFDYLKNQHVDVVSIQSVRDKSFKFIVTDKKEINDIYDILSTAKSSDAKSTLQPDYIFEIKMGDDVKKYNYVVGGEKGNFYDDSKSFTVSKSLDESLIKNLSVTRKPTNFDYVYYNSILKLIELKEKEIKDNNYKVGVDITLDIDCLKYVFSADIDKFLSDAKKIVPNIDMVNNNQSDFDVVIEVKNRGYNETNYKSDLNYKNNKTKIEEPFYAVGKDEFKQWDIDVYSQDNIPKEVKKKW